MRKLLLALFAPPVIAVSLAALDGPPNRVAAQEVPPPRAIEANDGALFGCQTVAVYGGTVLRRYIGDAQLEEGVALPPAVARALLPRARSVTVLGPEGACSPRLGAPELVYETGGDPIVGQPLGGCGRRVASLALLDCEVPTWLRYLALEAHIENLPRSGALADPALEALAQRPLDFLDADHAAEQRARLRRRVRRSSVRTAREELLVLELHRFLEGAHPCEYDESVETSVAVRRVDRDPPGPWEALSPVGRVVGAYVDDAGWILALDTIQSPREGPCEVGPRHMLTCDLLAIERRDGTTVATRSIGYAMNATFRGATSLLAYARECNQTGY